MATHTAASSGDFTIGDIFFSSPVLRVLASTLGGIVVPVLDNILGPTVQRYLTLGLSIFEKTNLLAAMRLSGVVVHHTTSLFKFFGIWHALLFIPPTVWYNLGFKTDFEFTESLALVEWQIYLYFGPFIAARVMKSLWSVRFGVVVAFISLIGTWTLSSKTLKGRVTRKFFGALAYGWTRTHAITIRGLLLRGFDTIIGPLSRLLRLNRRFFFSVPTCKLIHILLDEAPHFEAISYTWGDKDPSVPLVIDGQQVLVTSAVEELLCSRGSIFGTRMFWIDAVCINQTSVTEKSEQLPLMTEIYRRASRVLVWLGPQRDAKETHLTRQLIKAFHYSRLSWITGVSTIDILPVTFDKEGAAFIGLAKLFAHPWFQRIWVIQEVAVAETVHVMYNGICIEWDTLALVVKEISANANLYNRMNYYRYPKATSGLGLDAVDTALGVLKWPNAVAVASMRDLIRGGKPLPLSVLVLSTLQFKCTDPRDKIFALLGIASDGAKFPFEPGYADSTEFVFIKSAVFMLSSNEWFVLLSFTGRGYDILEPIPQQSHLSSLPSWVPDYSSPTVGGAQTGKSTFEKARLHDKTGKVTFTKNPRVIQIEAFAFDSIQHLGPKTKYRTSGLSIPDPETPIPIEQLEEFLSNAGAASRNWYLQARQLARKYSAASHESEDAADQTFWELCMSGETGFENSEPSSPLYPPLSPSGRKLFEFFLLTETKEMLKHSGESVFGEKVTTEESCNMNVFLVQKFVATITGKAFCITSAGSMALVPPLVKEEDVLVHVKGGYIPLVLRAKQPGERIAELVGTCRVQGVEDLYLGPVWEHWLLE
ncbi:MAG: hypothetical protein M1839_009302 [Geoglossum umbratile]|nr:MAG: hypothetical protein M1839_009302 [Geoglossum umbratile]